MVDSRIRKAAPRWLVPSLIVALGAVAIGALLWPSPEDSPDRVGDAASAAPTGADTAAYAPAEPLEVLRYDTEYPDIAYSATMPSERIAALEAELATGAAQLVRDPERGYLDSLLLELDIDPESQTLVFSTTSLQVGSIRATTPRAIYFNDDTYVAWVQGGGPLEIASMDPRLGPVFHTLEQADAARFERHTVRCLRCHDSLSLSGGGVPRFIVGSGYIGPRGNIVAHEGWILTTPATPLRNRWGGWYVTGQHGDQVHLGNIVVRNLAELQRLDELRRGNLQSLDGLIDTRPYLEDSSDIVALLVLQHQVAVQNEIARVLYALRGGRDGADVATAVEPLVAALLCVGEAELTDRIAGNTGFAARFEQRGPFDSAGRTLRELDLTTRLLRYPLSYLIYSEAFRALPEAAVTEVYRRLDEILLGADDDERFDHLSVADRTAIRAILLETEPAFAAVATR